MDIRRILRDERMDEAFRAPQLGLLSQTIAPTPVVKWILRAQIRNEDVNDIIIVRETSIELKQVVGRGLRTVAVKTDFDASIRAARILGKPKSLRSPQESAKLFQERFAESGYTSDGSFVEIDNVEPSDSPPQMLVLTLRSGPASRLMFLSARDNGMGTVRFVSTTYPLPSHRFDAGRPDAHLAIDPRCAALATAAQSDTVIVGALKSQTEILHEMDYPDLSREPNFTPFKEIVKVPLSATILYMEYLQPPEDNASRDVVLLVLVCSNAGQGCIRLLQWDSSLSLCEIRDTWRGSYPTPYHVRNCAPSQLIPAGNHCGFILAYDKYMLAYKDLTSGYTRPYQIQYPHEKPRSVNAQCVYEFGQPGRPRYWTAWARPHRHAGFMDKKQDALYLGREDGLVTFMMLNSGSVRSERHEVGRVNISIDAGFESLDSGEYAEYNTSDLLLMAGNSSDGGLFQYYPRRMPALRPNKLRNWTPVLDWTTIPAGPLDYELTHRDPLSMNAGRIFACVGYGMRHGKVCEVKFGIEAARLSEIPLEMLNISRPTRLWLWPKELPFKRKNAWNPDARPPGQNNEPTNTASHPFALLLSGPGGGTELVTVGEHEQLESAHPDSRIERLIDREAETLAASITADELAVQITTKAIRIASVSGEDQPIELTIQTAPNLFTQAIIDGRTSTCLLCIDTSEGHEIHCLQLAHGERAPKIDITGKVKGSDLSLGISSVCLHTAVNGRVVMVGTADGQLLLYKIGFSGVSLILRYAFQGESAVCESICCLQRLGDGQLPNEIAVLCGLRNGNLQVLSFQSVGEPSLALQCELQIGPSTVWAIPEFTTYTKSALHPTAAILVCQNMLFRLAISNHSYRRHSLHRIWRCHPEMKSIPQNQIFAVGQFHSWLGRQRSSKIMCYVDGAAVRTFTVDQSRFSSPLPCPIGLTGTPRRVVYSKSIKKLVVAHEELVMIPSWPIGSKESAGGRQFTFSKVRVIDPDDAISPQRIIETVVGLSGDRITALLEWQPQLNENRWPLLVVTTMRKRDKEGCIYIYRIEQQDDGSFLKLQKEIPRAEPMHSVVAFGTSRLAYGCGNRLEVIQLAYSERGLSWEQPSQLQVQLDSPARELSTHDNEIFVTTSEHSHIVCSLIGDQLAIRYTDAQMRYGLQHIYMGPETGLLIGSDSHGGIRGYCRPEAGSQDGKMRTMFEAHLQNPITRLCRADGGQSPFMETSSDIRPAMLGVSIAGAFYSFDLIPSHQWRLLRFVQNLLARQPEICPATYMDNELRQVQPGTGPEHKHVNGDILKRLLDQAPSGAAYLQAIMEAPPRQPQFETDFASVHLRLECFWTLMREAFRDWSSEDPYQKLVTYLERVLRHAN